MVGGGLIYDNLQSTINSTDISTCKCCSTHRSSRSPSLKPRREGAEDVVLGFGKFLQKLKSTYSAMFRTDARYRAAKTGL